MKTSKSVTRKQESVTHKRDTLARARPSFGGDVTLSRCNARRDVTSGERDSDMRPFRDARHHHEQQRSYAAKPMSVLHVAAMNLLADHEAGLVVTPAKIEAARKLLGRAA